MLSVLCMHSARRWWFKVQTGLFNYFRRLKMCSVQYVKIVRTAPNGTIGCSQWQSLSHARRISYFLISAPASWNALTLYWYKMGFSVHAYHRPVVCWEKQQLKLTFIELSTVYSAPMSRLFSINGLSGGVTIVHWYQVKARSINQCIRSYSCTVHKFCSC